jgi:hypothetical protein
MGAWDYGLYGSDEALEARTQLLAAIMLPAEPELFAASVGLLALLEPEARQFETITDHEALAKLPPSLREATAVAAMVGASGPRLPYSDMTRDILGIDASYGRFVDPLLQLRETIMIARAIREQCVRTVDAGFAYGETAIGGVVGVLLELRELGIAVSPDLVDEWQTVFEAVCQDARDDVGDPEFLREWARSYRAGLKLLATPPDQKLLGSDPIGAARNKRAR